MRRSLVALTCLVLAAAVLGVTPASSTASSPGAAAPATPAAMSTGEAAAQQRAASALVLSYTMNSAIDTRVRDVAQHALHGTLVNGTLATALVAGRPGRGSALSLVGEHRQFVAVPEHAALDVNRYTLSAWVRYTGEENDATLGRWEVMEKAGAYWLNVRTNGLVRVGGFFGGCAASRFWIFLDSTRTVPEGIWTHVASTYNGARLTVWINGTAAGSKAVSGASCANDEPLAVGAKNAPSKGLLEAFWDGLLDDVKIWNRALTATEVRQLACIC